MLSPEQYGMFEEHQEVLEKLGFEFEKLDERKIKIISVPAVLKDATVQSLLPSVFDEWLSVDEVTAEQDIRLATMACRAAVKAGDTLSDDEVLSMLEQVAVLDEKYTCPHGRPFKIVMNKKEIDGWFKRTGF